MTTQSKKDKELAILRTVFKKKRFRKYTFNEKPDFVVHAKEDFGVEITEYYPDETVARLHNSKDYAQKVVDNTYIHKDDKNVLEVVNTEYFDEKKQKWIKLEVPAVRQENKSIQERIGLLIKQIQEKSKLYPTYDQSLSSIDLIVYDGRASLIDGMNDEYMRKVIKEIQENGIFSTSGFRSIYLSIPGFGSRPDEVLLIK